MQFEIGAEVVATGMAVLTGLAVWLRRERGEWAKTNAAVARAEADESSDEARKEVVEMMRVEMMRLSAVNAELAAKVNQFQLENVNLRTELATLTVQVNRFQAENAALHADIINLREELKTATEIISRCSTCPNVKN